MDPGNDRAAWGQLRGLGDRGEPWVSLAWALEDAYRQGDRDATRLAADDLLQLLTNTPRMTAWRRTAIGDMLARLAREGQ